MHVQINRKIAVCALIGVILALRPLCGNAQKGPMILSLSDFIKLVVEKNERILAQESDYTISREAVGIERSLFEPQFTASYQRGAEKMKYSQEEKSFLLFGTERDMLQRNYNAAIETKVPTGASMRLGYTMKASRDLALDEEDEYSSNIGVELTQPILKDAGFASTVKIDAAEADANIAFQVYRQKILQVILNAAATCWDYYEAKERLNIRRDSVEIAEKILHDNRERVNLGKMAKTEVLEAEAGLAKRKSLEVRAEQDLRTAIDNLRSFISSLTVEIPIEIRFDDEIGRRELLPDFTQSMDRALRFRPEYLAAIRRIEKEDILIAYAKNQRWPKLDLTGSYRFNGLDDTGKDSWNDMFDGDYRTWSVGAVLTIPLMGGMKSKGELITSIERKRQAQLELDAFRVEVANTIHTAIRNVSSTRDQVRYYREVRNLNQRLLDVEMEMLNAGRSNSRSVLEKEEDLNEAREAELDSFIENRKAVLMLETAEGSVLRRYGVEVMEEGK